MKRITDLRQLQVGNIVLAVEYDHEDFASNDPDGWSATTCRVINLGSKEFLPRTLVIELKPLDEDYDDVFCITQGQEFVSMPLALFGSDESSFVHNRGMAGDSDVKLFLLQTHGMEDDFDGPEDPRWGEVPEGREIKNQWSVDDLPLSCWAKEG